MLQWLNCLEVEKRIYPRCRVALALCRTTILRNFRELSGPYVPNTTTQKVHTKVSAALFRMSRLLLLRTTNF